MEQRFSAARRDTTVFSVKDLISFYFFPDVFYAHFFSHDGKRTGRTYLHAMFVCTFLTFFVIYYLFFIFRRNCLHFACCNTFSTMDALYVFAIYKRFCSPRFRIAAPSATQRTPFKKYVCSDTRSVMYGISLNIKYICFHCFIHLLFPLGFLQIHLCTRNNVFLQFLVQGCKQCIVACYPYHQILIILRVLLCIPPVSH